MDLVIKLNGEVAGKDKLARLLQYSCRVVWDSLNAKDDAHLVFIHQLKSLEYILSSFRKCKTDKIINKLIMCFITRNFSSSAKIWKVNRSFLRSFEDDSLQRCLARVYTHS